MINYGLYLAHNLNTKEVLLDQTWDAKYKYEMKKITPLT